MASVLGSSEAFAVTTSHNGRRQFPHLFNSFLEHNTHSHKEMRLYMAMECPNPRVICPEPQSSPPVRMNRDRVLHDRVLKIVVLGVTGPVELAGPVPQNPEIMAVIHGVGVLENYVHCGVELEPVNGVAGHGVGVVLDGKDVVVEGDVINGPSSNPIDFVLCVEHDDDAVGGSRRRVDETRVGFHRPALFYPGRGVVPARPRGWGGGGISPRMVWVVIEYA
nr:Os09g0366101 [Ipomoea batatas]